jgi:hypothetical protein
MPAGFRVNHGDVVGAIKLPAFLVSNKIPGVQPNRLENLDDLLAPKHTMGNSAGIGPSDSTATITQLIVFYSRLLASLIPNDRIEGCRIRCANCSKNWIWRGVSTATLSTSRIWRITSPPARREWALAANPAPEKDKAAEAEPRAAVRSGDRVAPSPISSHARRPAWSSQTC